MREWYWLLSGLLVLGMAFEILQWLCETSEGEQMPAGMRKAIMLGLMLGLVCLTGWVFSALDHQHPSSFRVFAGLR